MSLSSSINTPDDTRGAHLFINVDRDTRDTPVHKGHAPGDEQVCPACIIVRCDVDRGRSRSPGDLSKWWILFPYVMFRNGCRKVWV